MCVGTDKKLFKIHKLLYEKERERERESMSESVPGGGGNRGWGGGGLVIYQANDRMTEEQKSTAKTTSVAEGLKRAKSITIKETTTKATGWEIKQAKSITIIKTTEGKITDI